MRLSRLRVCGLTFNLSSPAVQSKLSFWMTWVTFLLGQSGVRGVGCRQREVDIRECDGCPPLVSGIVAVGGNAWRGHLGDGVWNSRRGGEVKAKGLCARSPCSRGETEVCCSRPLFAETRVLRRLRTRCEQRWEGQGASRHEQSPQTHEQRLVVQDASRQRVPHCRLSRGGASANISS